MTDSDIKTAVLDELFGQGQHTVGSVCEASGLSEDDVIQALHELRGESWGSVSFDGEYLTADSTVAVNRS